MTQNGVSIAYRFLALTVFSAWIALSFNLNKGLVRRSQARYAAGTVERDSSVSFRWHPDLYQILSVGHTPSAVDWLLIRFLTDFNLSRIRDDHETELSRVLNLATDIDPLFFSLYTSGSNYLAVVRNDRMGALKLIQKGDTFRRDRLPSYPPEFRAKHWPKPWQISMIIGYIYLIEFQDAERAAKYYADMVHDPLSPSMIRSLAWSMQSIEGRFRVAINSMEVVKAWYREDPLMTAELDNKLKYLVLGQALYTWNRDLAVFPKTSPKEPDAHRFARFKSKVGVADRDGFGKRIYFNDRGVIASETPLTSVFGIDLERLAKGSL